MALPGEPSRANERIRVVICDDHALFRRGLMIVLESADDIEVVGEAANGTEAIELVTHVAPDVVLMDVRMPKVDGIAATRAILEVLPTVDVVMLTVSDDEDDLLEAMKAGAAGYLLKEIGTDEVVDAVRAVHEGQRLVTPSLAAKLITEFVGSDRRRSRNEELDTPRLTARELEVLRNVADGSTNREIARRLGISENTVKNHVRNILEKLRLHTRMEAVLYAMREQLLDPP
ncbi:MAG TPA: response regulator transcription factor [Acidimicrobiales bacterium]